MISLVDEHLVLEYLGKVESKADVLALVRVLRDVKQNLDPEFVHDVEEAVQQDTPRTHPLLYGWNVISNRYNMFLGMLPLLEEIFEDDSYSSIVVGNPLEDIVLEYSKLHPDAFSAFFTTPPLITSPAPPVRFSPTDLRPLATFQDPSGQPIRTASFSRSGEYIAIGTNSHSLIVCETSKMRQIGRVDNLHAGSVYTCAWDASDDYITTGSNDQTIRTSRVTSIRSNRTDSTKHHLHAGTVRSLAYIDNSTIVTGCSADALVRGVNVNTGETVWEYDCEEGFVNSVAANKTNIAYATSSGKVFVIDTRGRVEVPVWNMRVANTPCVVAMHKDYVCVGSDVGDVSLFDIRSDNSAIWSISAHKLSCRSVSFNCTGQYIATASFDKTSKIIDTATGSILTTLRGHSDKVVHCQWSPTEEFELVTCGTDSTVVLWSV
jgi:WD40 repeat protein